MKIHLTAILLLSVFLLGCGQSVNDALQQGQQFSNEAKWAEAELSFRKALQKDTRNAAAFHGLGKVLKATERMDQAYAAWDQAFLLAPENKEYAEDFANLALTLYMSRPQQLRMVRQRLENVALLAAKSADGAFWAPRIAGYLAITDGNYEEAIAQFRKALLARPNDADTSLALLKPLFELNRGTEAEAVATAAIAANPDFAQLYDALYVHYLVVKDAAKAEEVLRRKVQNRPKDMDAALQLCSFLLDAKRDADFQREVDRVLQAKAVYPQGDLAVSRFYAARQRWTEAKQVLQQAAEGSAQARNLYQGQMLALLIAQNKTEQALAEAEQLITQNPQHEQALYIRTSLRTDSAKPAELAPLTQDWQRLVTINPKAPLYHFKLGQVLARQTKFADAKTAYQSAIALDAKFLSPRMGMAEIRFEDRQYQEVLKEVEAIQKVDSRNPEVRLLGASAMMGLGNYSTAQEKLEEILRDFPRYPDAELQLGYVHLNLKQYPPAERIFEKYRSAAGALGERANRGLISLYLESKRGAKAVEIATQALQRDPKSTAALERVGVTAMQANQLSTAASAFEKWSTQEPQSARARIALGEAYRQLGRFEDAERQYRQAARLDAKADFPLLMLAHLKSARGDLQEARNDYRQLLPLRPNDPYLLNNYAVALVETNGSLAEALQHAQKAVKLQPDNPDFKDTLGWVQARSNQLESAKFIFEGLVQASPGNAVYRYHYGYTLLKAGQTGPAKEQLREAIRFEKDTARQDKIRTLLAEAN